MLSKNYKKKIKVFVTGAGCAIGQAIIKSLNISKLKINISVGDISQISLEIYNKNKFLIPKVEKKKSLKWYLKFFKLNKFDIIFIGSEYEIEFFSKHKVEIEKKTGTLICISHFDTIKLFNDKLSTIKFLKKNNFNYPKTLDIKNKVLKNKDIKLKYPLYLKNTKGTSSRNVFLVKNLYELKEKSKLIQNPIIQENLGKKYDPFCFHDEYTCSLFYGKNGELIGPFLSERILKHGTSWAVRSIKNRTLKNLIIKLGKNLRGIGSINFQLKKHKNKFYIFEINPRFSGTTYIRAILGFNEPELFVKNYFLNQKLININYRKGNSYRYFDDIVKLNNRRILKKNLKHSNWC
tara:strand:- start:6596 stop:7642 length:1047 start_codon:yes stop_codon:yes gene_type:complete